MTTETCNSDYFADTGAVRHFAAASIHCTLFPNHGGDHEEWVKNVISGAQMLFNAWPQCKPEPPQLRVIGKCAAQYMPQRPSRGDRIVQCSLNEGHKGDHVEIIDGYVAHTFPALILKTEPRVWSLPDEPGPEVTKLRGDDYEWERSESHHGRWHPVDPLPGDEVMCEDWVDLLCHNAKLTDATHEETDHA